MMRATMRAPSFVALEKAFWTLVDEHCPHPLQSRHRYSWVRENVQDLRFEFEGVVYERTTTPVRVHAGKLPRAAHAVTFTSEDGSIVVADDPSMDRAA